MSVDNSINFLIICNFLYFPLDLILFLGPFVLVNVNVIEKKDSRGFPYHIVMTISNDWANNIEQCRMYWYTLFLLEGL